MSDNDGFEDLNSTENDSTEEVESSEENDSTEEVESSEESDSTDEVVDDSENEVEALKATISMLQTEIGLKDAEIAQWKANNMQLLLSMPGDGSVDNSNESDDGEEDDPEPFKDESGASRLFTTK